MLIFEAWDMIANLVEYFIEECQIDGDVEGEKKLVKAFKKCDGLMDLLLMKIDSMEDEITITRDEITGVLDDER